MKIIFYVQSGKMGGSTILFLKMASYISVTYPDYEVYYINHRNATLEKQYSSQSLTVIDVNKVNVETLEDSVIFTPFNYAYYVAAKFRRIKNAKLVFYFYHPDSIKWLEKQNAGLNNDLRPLLQMIRDSKSYCFMDASNYHSVEKKYGMHFSEKYLPVVVENNSSDLYAINGNFVLPDRISIGWMGRLDADKIYSLLNILYNLMDVDIDINFDFHIIGDGNAKHLINPKKYSKRIRIFFNSILSGKDRDQYIVENVDLMIAMGMSASDSAFLGVATAIPLVSNCSFKDDKFIPIYQSIGYSLGWNKEDSIQIKNSCCTMNELLKLLIKDKYSFAKNSRDYVLGSFSINNASMQLISIINQTELTMKDYSINPVIVEELKQLDFFSNNSEDFEAFHKQLSKNKQVKG